MTIGAGHAGTAGSTASQAGSSFNAGAMALLQQHELQGLRLPDSLPLMGGTFQ